jgi:hypothetical protein
MSVDGLSKCERWLAQISSPIEVREGFVSRGGFCEEGVGNRKRLATGGDSFREWIRVGPAFAAGRRLMCAKRSLTGGDWHRWRFP